MSIVKFMADCYRALKGSGKEIKTLSKELNKYLSTMPNDREGIHVSDLTYMCLRKIALKMLHPEMKDGNAAPALGRRFQAGHSAHYWYQNKLHGPMGVLWGHWKCSVCGKDIMDFMPDQCEECDKTRSKWEYCETKVSDKDIRISGAVDGFIKHDDKVYLIDYKTVQSDLWKEITLPNQVHVRQLNLYLWLLKRDNHYDNHKKFVPNFPIEHAIVCYIQKDTFQEKIFEIPIISGIEDEVIEIFSLVKLAIEREAVNSLSGRCKKETSVYAKKCAFRKFCF